MIAFISGHLDLTPMEFEEHYVPHLKTALGQGHSFVVGDARGCDFLAQGWCALHGANVTVFHMYTKPRNRVPGLPVRGGFSSDETRDAAMTAASTYDIAWVRPGREESGTARNLARRQQ